MPRRAASDKQKQQRPSAAGKSTKHAKLPNGSAVASPTKSGGGERAFCPHCLRSMAAHKLERHMELQHDIDLKTEIDNMTADGAMDLLVAGSSSDANSRAIKASSGYAKLLAATTSAVPRRRKTRVPKFADDTDYQPDPDESRESDYEPDADGDEEIADLVDMIRNEEPGKKMYKRKKKKKQDPDADLRWEAYERDLERAKKHCFSCRTSVVLSNLPSCSASRIPPARAESFVQLHLPMKQSVNVQFGETSTQSYAALTQVQASGATVLACAWLPGVETSAQVLAVSVSSDVHMRTMDKQHGCIQLWCINDNKSSTSSELLCVLSHKRGTALDLAWCPNVLFTNCEGLLTAATTNGSVIGFCLSQDLLQPNTKRAGYSGELVGYEIEPNFVLHGHDMYIADEISVAAPPITQLDWHLEQDLLLALGADGYVLLWTLSGDNPSVPHVINSHDLWRTRVVNVQWLGAVGEKILMTCLDRTMHVYDHGMLQYLSSTDKPKSSGYIIRSIPRVSSGVITANHVTMPLNFGSNWTRSFYMMQATCCVCVDTHGSMQTYESLLNRHMYPLNDLNISPARKQLVSVDQNGCVYSAPLTAFMPQTKRKVVGDRDASIKGVLQLTSVPLDADKSTQATECWEYSECADNLKLVVKTEDWKDQPRTQADWARDECQTGFPLKSLHRVNCCPNMKYTHLTAVGGNAGFVFVVRL